MVKRGEANAHRPQRYHVVIHDSELNQEVVRLLHARVPKRATLVRKLIILGFESWRRTQEDANEQRES